ncbi:MAG TPA: tetratricopeptide repeat protein [Candidatus Limnocylindria bacterium]|nr:tetratricopeptide repeat protein [Candidatus Limnocylindria bacterium]
MPEKSIAQIPAQSREMFDKGIAALQKNNLDYAVTLFVQVLKNEPGFYECREALRAAQHKRAGASGGGWFKKLTGTASSLTKGRIALRNDPFSAIIVAEEALNDNPSNQEAHELLAEAALLARLPKTALLSLEIAFKAKPSDRKLAEKLANTHAQLGNRGRAEKILRDLLALDPTDSDLNEKLKNVIANRTLSEGGYEKLGQEGATYRDALRDKEQAVSLEQENRAVKDVDVAARLIAEYEAKLAKEGEVPRLLKSVAELYEKKGDFDKAIGYYERILAATGINDPTILLAIRDAQLAKFDALDAAIDADSADAEDQKNALRQKRAAFQIDETKRRADSNPTDLHIRYELGLLYFNAGKLGEAISELQKAQNNPSKRIAAMSLLARAFHQRGMNDMGARKLQEALKEKQVFDEEAKDLRYTLGLIYEKMGKKEEAIEQFKFIYEQDIAYRDVMQRVDAYYAG